MARSDSTDDFEHELEGLDLASCRAKIAVLLAERERRRDSTQRTHERVKAMNYELSARREEAFTWRQQVQGKYEQNRQLEGQIATASAPWGTAVDYDLERLRRAIEQRLGAVVPRRPEVNELGIRLYGEMELMVQKPAEVERVEQTQVDTVLITHWRRSGSEQKFHLSYRVSASTMVRDLREDACRYWGISREQYVLWTLGNEKLQADLLIRKCFKPGEPAHLILAPKVPKNVLAPQNVQEAICAKIGPKSRALRKKTRSSVQNSEVRQGAASTEPDNFYEQMAQAPGLFDFMTQRDRRVVSHLPRIRFCSLCIYALLLVLTCLSIAAYKPKGQEYLSSLGVTTSVSGVGEEFQGIRDSDAAWSWLTHTVSSQLLRNTSSLRMSNYLPGWLRVSMQQVKPASHAECMQHGLPEEVKCFSEFYTQSSADKTDLKDIQSYWSGVVGLDGRSNDTVPWKFMTEQEAIHQQVGSEAGQYQRYDPSGYAVDYNLQHSNLTAVYEAFVADMIALRNASWISRQTRAVHVTFLAYNPAYDYWMPTWYMLEFPANGVVRPSARVQLFRSVFHQGKAMGMRQLVVDMVRIPFVALVLLYQVTFEAMSEWKQSGKAWRYFLGPRGLADLGIIGIFIAILLERYLHGFRAHISTVELVAEASKGYLGAMWRASAFHRNSVLEAFLLCLVVWRLLASTKVNRHVFLIWKTLSSSLAKFARMLMVFAPALAGFVLLAHVIWRPQLAGFQTFFSSAASVLMILVGDDRIAQHGEVTRPGTIIYILGFYCGVVIFAVSSWTAVLAQEYQKTRIAAGFRPEEYAWSEYDYVSWLLPAPLKKAYCLLRPSIVPSKDIEEIDDSVV
mmetsp:Transcript_70716/g.183530  ORF Transcript_70716/g.183530 Transcript_70716/m.183530 type:complete len:848 (-) Transcript_70716:29-2572(-)